ncbi:AfsR family transcriptional regulator [Actinoplanes sp. ATCC 53533]|nr:AfsR family transcriptional regulator [Actinoplanes sp. ATCC 53533]
MRALTVIYQPRPPDWMEFRLLGALQVESAQGAVPVSSAQQRVLLATLLVRAGQVVPADFLVGQVWQDRPPASARAALQVRILRLRRLLGDGDRPEPMIVTRQSGYLFRLADPDQLDITRFERLLVESRTIEDPRRRSAGLHEALSLWRGPALVDIPSQALQELAVQLNESRLVALEQRIEADLRLGRHQDLVAELRGLTAEHPLREGFWAQLVLALAGSDQRAAALAAYDQVYRRLSSELGVEPGPALRASHLAVLREGATPETPDAAPVTGRTVAPVPALLPPDVPDFTGRERQLAELRTVLNGPDRPAAALPIAGIAGMGGIGKTALAVHLTHRLAASYPDGQLFVNLRGAEAAALDPSDVLLRFLRALGMESRAVPADPVERAGLYRSLLADRRILVVLDNAVSEAQVRPLLPGVATCAVLITSRARLTGLEGARWIELDVLEPDEAVRFLGRVTDERRIAAQPGDAAEIVRLCGRLPLAVRVAGARLTARPSWTLAHLAGRLGNERSRLDQLTSGDLGVRASLALSYDGLDERARRLFRLLGPFDILEFPEWMAPALLGCPHDDAVASVESLVDAQLLTIAGTDPSGQSHYRFHDLVRLYARDRAEAEDDAGVRAGAFERGLGAWLAHAERMARRVPGPCYAAIHGDAPRTPVDEITGIEPLAWFDAERAGLMSAVHQACDLGLHELAFDLAGCLEKYFDLRGMYVEWDAVNKHVMSVCRAAGNLRGEAVMLRGLIEVSTWNSGDSAGEAMDHLHSDARRLLEMFTEIGDARGTADAAVQYSWALAARGEHGQAVETATRSLRLAEGAGHLGGQARAHVALAVAHAEHLRFDTVIEHLTEALQLTRNLDNPRYEATVQQFLGIAYNAVDDLDAGERALTASLSISRRYRDDYTETLTMLGLARLYAKRGDARAAAAAETALAMGREYDMTHHVADALTILGELDLAAGRRDSAIARLREAVRLWRTRGWQSFLATALRSLGDAYAGTDEAAARAAWTEARALFARSGQEPRAEELARQLDERDQVAGHPGQHLR